MYSVISVMARGDRGDRGARGAVLVTDEDRSGHIYH